MTLARGPRGRFGTPWIMLPVRWVYVLAAWCMVGGLALPWIASWQGVLRVKGGTPNEREHALRPALIELPGATFVMGSAAAEQSNTDDEGPQRQVTVLPFQICQTEVTQEQWEAVMRARPSDCLYGCGDALPVQTVSWYEAVKYLNELTEQENKARGTTDKLTRCYEEEGETVEWKEGCTGYRLPTEAEWEYAARAGTQTAYSFGNDAGKLGKFAWYDETAEGRVHEVGTKKANDWGLLDMHGNVGEWVWDWYGSETETDPRGPTQGAKLKVLVNKPRRVVRGGSFASRAMDLRSAHRGKDWPQFRRRDTGLRCARSALPSVAQ